MLTPTEAVDLPRGCRLRVTAVEEPGTGAVGEGELPPPTTGMGDLMDWIESLPPIEGWESPGDGSMQVDHYVYGTPKRENP